VCYIMGYNEIVWYKVGESSLTNRVVDVRKASHISVSKNA